MVAVLEFRNEIERAAKREESCEKKPTRRLGRPLLRRVVVGAGERERERESATY